jgi:hypothetical protein
MTVDVVTRTGRDVFGDHLASGEVRFARLTTTAASDLVVCWCFDSKMLAARAGLLVRITGQALQRLTARSIDGQRQH